MTVCVLGSQYIPSAEYFAHWVHHGTITMERHEHYQKRSWRNKTAITSPADPLILTVPLRQGKHQQMPICDVLVAYDSPWPKNHLNSIKTMYGNTAFFDELIPGLESLLITPTETLWELNLRLIDFVISFLPGVWKIEFSDTYHPKYPGSTVDLRNGIPAGKASLASDSLITYPQLQRIHKSHLPNLCILDALCHLGPETYSYLSKYAAKLYPAP